MKSEKYNGWTNYETWNVKLWIDNDQGSQEMWQERAQEAFDSAEACNTFTKEERAALNLMDTLKSDYEERGQELLESANAQCSCFADLLGAALSEVNWHEIAESLLGDVEKETAETISGS